MKPAPYSGYSSFSHNMQTLPSDIFSIILNNLPDIYDVSQYLSVCKQITRVPNIYKPFNKLKMFGRISQELDDIDLLNLMLTNKNIYYHPELYSRIDNLQFGNFLLKQEYEEQHGIFRDDEFDLPDDYHDF